METRIVRPSLRLGYTSTRNRAVRSIVHLLSTRCSPPAEGGVRCIVSLSHGRFAVRRSFTIARSLSHNLVQCMTDCAIAEQLCTLLDGGAGELTYCHG
jgi:hypothetical protein